MLTAGQKLENGIESLIALSEDIAELQSKYESAVNDLSMYNSLIQIQKYLGSGNDLNHLLPSIEDVIVGVFGTSWCKIVIHDEDIKSLNIQTGLDLKKLNMLELNQFKLDKNMEKELFGLDHGQLFVMRMKLMDGNFGYIILYWGYSLNISDNSMRFLELLKSQLEISIQNAQLINKFKSMSITDPLTGVYNRAYFNEYVIASQPDQGDSVIMFDIDHFKLVNDTKGHAYGDVILKEFASILIENCEDTGQIIRYGGEEFVVACSSCLDAARLADKIRYDFARKTACTVSAGVAACTESDPETSFEGLCRRADYAMYQSKENGRNRTTVFNCKY